MNTLEQLLASESGAFLIAVIIFVILVLRATLRVLPEWERAVVLRLGRLLGVKGPGIIFLLPYIDRPIRVDTRLVTMDVPRQEVMTRDNVPVTVDAIVLFRVIDPAAAVTRIENFIRTTSLIAQTTLRSTLGQAELDDLLSHRDKINQQLQTIIDEQTEPYGVKVQTVEVRDVVLPDSMKRAMARQAESERERRAKVINAEGEYQAAERLVQAAQMMASQPAALQLRYLQTISEISTQSNSTTVIPIPVDLLMPFLRPGMSAAAPQPPAQPAGGE
ncbi:MAG: SPFH domain-containing protein [Chthonomonadetes bacterium]|nr:SPFH domain-containing protein [Chthonomonadetes bacterium]